MKYKENFDLDLTRPSFTLESKLAQPDVDNLEDTVISPVNCKDEKIKELTTPTDSKLQTVSAFTAVSRAPSSASVSENLKSKIL